MQFRGALPTRLQAVIIATARATPLHRGHARDAVAWLLRRVGASTIDVEFNGANLRLSIEPAAAVEIATLLDPQREREELKFLSEGLIGGVLVDIGAHVGTYALPLSRKAKRVIAIEPNPTILGRLKFNQQASGAGNVVIVTVATGDRDGEVAFLDDHANLGGSRVSEDGNIRVPVRLLLATLEEQEVTEIAALKIDVEGYEERALLPFFAAAPRTMWPRRMVIEHTHLAKIAGEDFVGALAERGYRIVGRTKKNLLLVLD